MPAMGQAVENHLILPGPVLIERTLILTICRLWIAFETTILPAFLANTKYVQLLDTVTFLDWAGLVIKVDGDYEDAVDAQNILVAPEYGSSNL